MIDMQAQFEAFKAVLSLTNEIDRLAVLDRQIKDLTAECKILKENISNTYGEGKHRGEKYGVRVSIEDRKGSVNMEKLCAAFGITDEQFETFRGESSAIIKVSPTA